MRKKEMNILRRGMWFIVFTFAIFFIDGLREMQSGIVRTDLITCSPIFRILVSVRHSCQSLTRQASARTHKQIRRRPHPHDIDMQDRTRTRRVYVSVA